MSLHPNQAKSTCCGLIDFHPHMKNVSYFCSNLEMEPGQKEITQLSIQIMPFSSKMNCDCVLA